MPHTNRKKNKKGDKKVTKIYGWARDPILERVPDQEHLVHERADFSNDYTPSTTLQPKVVLKKVDLEKEDLKAAKSEEDAVFRRIVERADVATDVPGLAWYQNAAERHDKGLPVCLPFKGIYQYGSSVPVHTKRTETAVNAAVCTKKFIENWIHKHRMMDDLLFTVRMTQEAAVTTDGSGLLATVYGSDPSSSGGWSNFAASFDSFRVLGVLFTFSPIRINGGSSATYQAPISVCCDYNDATALTGYSVAARYNNYHESPGGQGWKFCSPMDGLEAATFLGCTTPASKYWTKIYSSGNSASTTVGRMTVDFVVQFRGKGIS